MSQKQMSPELQQFMGFGREYFQAARQLNLRACAAILFDAKILVNRLIAENKYTFDSLRDEMLGQDPFMEQVKMLFDAEKKGTLDEPKVTFTLKDFMDAFVAVRLFHNTMTDDAAIALATKLGFKANPVEAPKPKLEVVQ